MTIADKTARFRALHTPGDPFVMPNPWDAGSARILEGLGFKALATTSSGFAITRGRRDYGVTREEAIAHCREIAAAVDLPVSADLENGFGRSPEDAAETIRLAAQTGIAGGSIEDFSGDPDDPILDRALAVERVAAAAEAARKAGNGFVLTARAEAFIYGKGVLDEVIARLSAFADAGADVLYAPFLPDMDAVKAVCGSVAKPVNALVVGPLVRHSVADFAGAGAARLSVGGGLAWKAYSTLAEAASMLQAGTFDALNVNRDNAKTVGAFLK